MNKISKNRPKIIRYRHHIIINWDNLFTNSNSFNVQMQNDLKEWKNIYWGTDTKLKVENLAPCTCYCFRLKSEQENEWCYFNGATDEGLKYTRHMTRAVSLGRTALIRELAHNNVELLNTENSENKTPLFIAIEKGNVQIVNLLIILGCNVNAPIQFINKTPLMFAVYRNELQIASLLIDKGADKKAVDANGMNLFHYAVDSNNLENVKFAIENTELINKSDNKGWTPLLRAVILEVDKEICDYLIENGADLSIKDKNGFDYQTMLKIKRNILSNFNK